MLFDRIFGKRKKLHILTEGSVQEGMPEPEVTMVGPDVGLLLRSRNGRFAVFSTDRTIREDVITHSDVTVLKDSKALFTRKLHKIHEMALAENGFAAFSCYKSHNELKSDFVVLDPSGAVVFQKEFDALGFSVGISSNGHFAAFQTANSVSEIDCSILVIVDVTSRRIILQRQEGHWANYYEWDELKRIVKKRFCPENEKDIVEDVPF